MSCSGGRAAPPTPRRSRTWSGCCARRAWTPRSSWSRWRATSRRTRERFPGLADDPARRRGRDRAARGRAVLAHLPRLPPARRARLGDAGPRGPARRREEDEMNIGDAGTHLLAARHRRPGARPGRRDRRRVHLQPLPLRAGLARRPAPGRARLRPSHLPRRQPQRRRALSGGLLRGDEGAGRRGRRLAASLSARREPGGRAGLRRADHARRVRPRCRFSAALPRRAGLRSPGPRRARRGCARRWMRCWRAEEPARPETEPVGCSIKWR